MRGKTKKYNHNGNVRANFIFHDFFGSLLSSEGSEAFLWRGKALLSLKKVRSFVAALAYLALALADVANQ